MPPPAVVKLEIDLEFLPSLTNRVVRFEIDFFILDAFPETLHENVVHPPPFSIHADEDSSGYKSLGKLIRRELTALVCVENPG